MGEGEVEDKDVAIMVVLQSVKQRCYNSLRNYCGDKSFMKVNV